MSGTFDYPGLRIREAFFDDPHSEVYLLIAEGKRTSQTVPPS